MRREGYIKLTPTESETVKRVREATKPFDCNHEMRSGRKKTCETENNKTSSRDRRGEAGRERERESEAEERGADQRWLGGSSKEWRLLASFHHQSAPGNTPA